ncbi:MAG: CRISPR-associated endonuclease Cas2 [Alphaproteobacteria bacterium]|nr:CRISPR-associated endonuclease Cas2 [Alphaproteobacteria bacterium]
MRFVLAYDVVGDRRRGRFFRRLKRLLIPTQKSVFEGTLDARQLAAVERLIHGELELSEDAVRVYALCRSCQGLVRSYGVMPEPRDPDAPILT